MADFRLSTVIVQTVTAYDGLRLSPDATVGQIARYLSQQEGYGEGSTLEIARLLNADQQLSDINMQTGDRMVIFTSDPDHAVLNTLSPGDLILRVSTGDFQISSGAKKLLTIGRTDEQSNIFPDIDLRQLLSERTLGFVSRECVELSFDQSRKSWSIRRLSNNPVMVDERELGNTPIAFSGRGLLRIYRSQDDPRNTEIAPLVELELRTEPVSAASGLVSLPAGAYAVVVQKGLERDTLKLIAKGPLTIKDIVQSVLKQQEMGQGVRYRAYLLSLVPPATPISELSLKPTEFLYAARSTLYMQSRLVLRDIHSRKTYPPLVAGRKDEEKQVGRRERADEENSALDVDLFPSANRADDPDAFMRVSRKQMRILYKAAENSWYARLEERTAVPVYVNNLRLTSDALVPLISGDVLTIGPSIEKYYARLEVEVISRVE